MKKVLYFITTGLLTVSLVACGGSEKAEETEETTVESPPSETTISSGDEDAPEPVTINSTDNRIVVSMDKVGPSEDTAAALVSGYIDLSGFTERPKNMSLKVMAKTDKGSKEHMMKIEEDGRVPGVWVAPDSDCHFTLTIAKETYLFEAKLAMALYRFKLSFAAKA